MEKDLLGMDNFNMYNIIEDTYSHFPSCVICLLEKKYKLFSLGVYLEMRLKINFAFIDRNIQIYYYLNTVI